MATFNVSKQAGRKAPEQLAAPNTLIQMSSKSIEKLLRSVEPAVATKDALKGLDRSSLCTLVCFMFGWHPLDELPLLLGLR